MNKFQKSISATDATLSNRAALAASQGQRAQQRLIAELEERRDNLKLQIDKLTDLSPDTTVGLKVAEFNPKEWLMNCRA